MLQCFGRLQTALEWLHESVGLSSDRANAFIHTIAAATATSSAPDNRSMLSLMPNLVQTAKIMMTIIMYATMATFGPWLSGVILACRGPSAAIVKARVGRLTSWKGGTAPTEHEKAHIGQDESITKTLIVGSLSLTE